MGLDLIYNGLNMVVSTEQRDWREWQDKFDDYKASLSFEDVEDISEYLIVQYKLISDVKATLVNAFKNNSCKLYLLDLPEEKSKNIILKEYQSST